MADTPEIARIRESLKAGPTPGPWEPWGSPTPTQFICSEDALIAQTTTGNDVANAGLILSCNPEAMTALLAHIDAQAAEIERLRADAGHAVALPDNAKVSGAGTASAGLPGYAGDGTGERNG